MRLIALALLTLVSMGAAAQTKIVQIANDGKFDGGTIEETGLEEQKEGGVKVTITVSPNSGYTIKKEAIKVYATYPPFGSRADTRDIEIASNLTLLYNGSEKEDVKDASAKRDYTFTVPSGFGAWVKDAKFQLDGSKGGSEPTRTIDPDNLSGVYYIGTVTHSTESTTNNFYLCPTEGYYYYQSTSPYYTNEDNGMPFLTTYKCRSTEGYDERKALWVIEKHPILDCYYIKHAIDGKYLTYNAGFLTNKGRVRFHLEESPSNNDYALFFINYYDNTSSYEIISKYASDNNIDPDGGKPRKYLNINKGNQPSLAGTNADGTQAILTGGIIGLWTAGNSESSGSGKFYLESAVSIDSPTITNNFDGTITIAAATGATIYYTTDGSTPTMSSPVYSTAITLTEDITVIKAIAKAESDYFPTVATTYNLPSCEKPTISVSGGNVTITCTTEGATIHFTTDGSHATSSSTVYTGPFAKGSANEIRAIATKVGYVNSNEAALLPPTEVSFSSEITDMNGNYSLASNFSSDVSIGTSENPFSGTIDGNYQTFSLSQAFIDVADGAIIKNIIISSANISGSGNAGAIVNTAKGSTRIYNCGVLDGSISGDDNVGGIAGELQGLSRVINCYNYANIESGDNCGGIVGYNSVPSTSSNLQTMVMNCMFYGNITGGNAAPIYGGEIIHNKYSNANNTGLNNYCYFLYDEEKVPYVKTIANDKYHGALGAEERYLNRFEFFRMTLNSTRNMAAFYVTGDATQKDEMAKWVLDKSIAPYPILKTQGKYPSVVNPDAAHATAQTDRNKGGLLGTLSVTISGVGGGAQFAAPSGATITKGSLSLNITDKDYDNFNYNYRKVQLPYYNEVGTGNYTKASDGTGRVVTGWKITTITGGTPGSFTTDTYDYPSFNFVDRKCTNKDLYGTGGSNRVFAQGAYWEVPDGVESITIEPYWAKAVYLGDANYDVTYNGTSKYGVTVGGSCPSTYNGQQVYNSVSSAMTALGSDASHSVYDYAVVLVGNYHQYADGALVNDTKPVTFMSADLDGDDEPDNTLFYYHNQRKRVAPIRFDFLNIPGVGMVKRTHDATMDPEPGIFKPRGWFEITNTVFIRFGQFEYAGGNNGDTKDIMAPLILQGGIYEQFVSCTRANAQNTNYLLIGSNAWFKNFANGCHTAQANKTPKVPINVAGGDYTNFYLTGIYQPNANEDAANAECYIDGGRFTEVAGAGMQQIKGDVTWLINAADITSFYGGGINAAKPITGSISTTISNSYVNEFYGGPKFGDMSNEKTVTTNATDCHFGKFFGAGYGGTAFYRADKEDNSAASDTRSWSSWVNKHYKKEYSAGTGISTSYDYEFILHSDGNQTVGRFFVNYASLSLASTRNVTSTLSGCTIGTFYGGGSLGAVNGDVNSTLTNCTVTGNVFGAGYSASVPTVEVWDISNMNPEPKYNRKAGVFNNANVKTPKDNNQFVVYTWSNTYGTNAEPFTDTEDGKHYIHTDVSLEGLGSVTGNATLTINGTTIVKESVYGGGEESSVDGNTEVKVTGGTIGYEGAPRYEDLVGNVYGGGRGLADKVEAGLVKGNTKVTIEGNAESPFIYHNIYGGGAYGSVGTYTYTDNKITRRTSGGLCEVHVKGGKIGTDGHNNGMVFGSSRGDVKAPVNGVDFNDYLAWVYDTHVIIGNEGSSTDFSKPLVKGSVYGSGENGHVYYNTQVDIHSGTIGVDEVGAVGDQRYTSRGNVYGGGCGTDTYTLNDKIYYNLYAGIVLGNTEVNIDGGHVLRNVYGAGSMGSVGTFTLVDEAYNTAHPSATLPIDKPYGCTTGGTCRVNISGGTIGNTDGKMYYEDPNIGPDNFGHVFGAGRGELQDSTVYVNMALTGYVNKTYVTISNNAFITGSVYGGGECGHTLGNTNVTISGGQIGVGDGETAPYTDWTATSLKETAHWPYQETNNAPYDKFSGDAGYDLSAAKGGAKKATDGHTFNGNVFGGGSGYYPYAPGKWVRSSGLVEGNTNITISGGHILSNVYGGNEMTDVYGSCTVTMSGGTIGVPRTWAEKRAHPKVGNLYGAGKGDKRVLFNTWTNVASTSVSVSGGRVYGSVYGGGEDGHVLGDATTTISGESTLIGTLGTTGYDGHVFGGGQGSYTALTAGVVCGNTTVNIEGGTLLGSVYGGGRLASVGTHLVPPTAQGAQTDHPYYGKEISDGKKQVIWKYADDNPDNDEDDDQEGLTHGHITVNIKGGVIGAVDNDGKLLNSQFSIGDVFGGCKGTTNGEYTKSDNNPVKDAQARLGISKSALVNILGGTVNGSIYGGGEVGNVGEIGIVDAPEKAFAKINLLGGTVNNVFGGGLGMKSGTNGATENVEALVKGDVKVNLNGLEQDDDAASLSSYVGSKRDDNTYLAAKGCIVLGTIFGCNNLNGTPTGHAKVHVFKTIARPGQANEGIDKVNSYDVAAVYGGGNQADYKPLASEQKQKSEVIIEGCGLSSIYQVYGGGNAAATPGTVVLVKGTKNGENDYGIYEVFGGGNGVSSPGFDNPGANIGYYTSATPPYTDYESGEGKALVQLMAGKITYAYGGSNTKGDIRGGSNVETVKNDGGAGCCTSLLIDHMFGGGKNAAMKSGANIILGCSNSNSWVKEIYAGAENADVIGDVSLTITSGKFGRVFGGNKESGKLEGSITVNIEENGKCGIPVIIGELYGGGNQAPYSVYGYNSDGSPKTEGTNAKNPPVVNIKAFTSIGNVYGGGYGERAKMYGSPTVNINEVEITHTDNDNTYNGNAYSGETVYFKNGILDPTITQDPQDMTGIEKVVIPAHADKKMGAILNVFGGGNAAAVYGNTQVNIGTTGAETLVELNDNGEPQYNSDGSPETASHDVKGADIRGNVYGGGNEAEVTGSTNVVVGKK